MSVVTSIVILAKANPLGPRMQTSHVTVKKVKAIPPTLTITPRTTAQMPRCVLPGKSKARRCDELIKPNQDITADAGREVDFGFEVEFNSH